MADLNLTEHLRRVMAFSRATFGFGERTKGLCEHIRKELDEIAESPDDGLRSNEWVDVVILGLDGLWRALEAEGVDYLKIAEEATRRIALKQGVNEVRTWPNWREQSPDHAIEHVRGA